MKYFRSLKRS